MMWQSSNDCWAARLGSHLHHLAALAAPLQPQLCTWRPLSPCHHHCQLGTSPHAAQEHVPGARQGVWTDTGVVGANVPGAACWHGAARLHHAACGVCNPAGQAVQAC